MYSHLLIKMANMLNKVCTTIIQGESGLNEPPGSLPSSIQRVRGDLEIWLSALLMASFPKPPEDKFLF